ncbi:unnamed protein product [Acanthoscelides obtectus]|nr:unnamed protein product [Acanthoscelides obtectus]CAK1620257.1 hypothetical protein AOBTE_LOCUS261 [Acanthoscelides obtectus]
MTQSNTESEMLKEKIKVENDFDSKKFKVIQTTSGFLKDEYGQYFEPDAAGCASDRFYDLYGTMPNFDSTEGTREGALKMQDEKVELQKDIDNRYNDTECPNELIIKSENAESGVINEENIEIFSNSIAVDHNFDNSWIKCEAVEELKLENESCGITETTEDYNIKDEDADFTASVSSETYECTQSTAQDETVINGSCKLFVCIHCNETFRLKRALDNHIAMKHPEHISLVSSKIHE